jgi:alkanesulfonate monooxygenase SsuD/methylene tetrahydromethanopterin reductase-like flavin-dependent oxidoreductase (luciferase family)
MKVWQFTEQPYYPAWEATKEQLKNTLPNKHLDPYVAADLLNRYLDEWELCDELGINILINEHHSTATCMSSSCTLPLAALARATKKVRLMSLGIPIANRADPVRVAEEVAIIDCYSRGRFEMGFVRGIDYDVFPANSPPVTQTRRFAEAFRLILKALTSHEAPFSWQGEFYNYRSVNIWPRSVQQPHPPVWMVALGPAAGGWIAEQKSKVGTFLTGRTSKQLYDVYRRKWLELGWGMPSPDQFGYMAIVAVADKEEVAKERAYKIAGYLRTQTRLDVQFQNPPGYIPSKFYAKKLRMESKGSAPIYTVPKSDGSPLNLHGASIDDLIDAHVAFAGTPDQVFEQIKAYNTHVGGCGNLLMMGQGGDLSHEDTVSSLKMFSKEVLPRLAELRVDGYEVPPAPQMAA